MASISSEVATGRRMKGRDGLIARLPRRRCAPPAALGAALLHLVPALQRGRVAAGRCCRGTLAALSARGRPWPAPACAGAARASAVRPAAPARRGAAAAAGCALRWRRGGRRRRRRGARAGGAAGRGRRRCRMRRAAARLRRRRRRRRRARRRPPPPPPRRPRGVSPGSVTRAPSFRRSAPSVITCSPACRPLAICTLSAVAWPRSPGACVTVRSPA